MENNENKELEAIQDLPENDEQQAPVADSCPVEEEPRREAVMEASSFVIQTEPEQEPVDFEEKPRENKKLKFWKRAVAAILVVALVVGSNCITATVLNNTWSQQSLAERSYLESLIRDLKQQLDNKVNQLGGEIIVSPQEGLTPAQVYEKNLMSVVAISCQSVIDNGNGQSYIGTASGSGFILTTDGYVVTNHHVVEGASSIIVILANEQEYKASLIGSDASNDIALLKVEAKDLQPVTIGSSNTLAVGSQVVAIGNALGELSFSLTVGYVSGKDRAVTTDGTLINMLQTDAAINPGNSGGPLFNMRGEVIGINTAKYSGQTNSGASIEGIGFAIPIDDVIGMLEDLRTYGYITGVRLGVMVSNVDQSVADAYGFPIGAYVQSVVEGSCAEAAGIRPRDIILSVGLHEIKNLNDLTRALRNFKAGQEATVKVWRGGRELLLTIVFDAKEQP